MIHWYWKDGTPAVSAEMGTPEWLEQMRAIEARKMDISYTRVARTFLGDGNYVSTVWLGLDHNHWNAGHPLIFESMLFPSMEDCVRYSTEAQALAGHDEMVARWSPKH